MKILKKKRLGILEVYFIFLSCIYAGFIGYKSLLNVLFTWNQLILWNDLINLPPSWSSSSFDAKKIKNIPREAIDNEIDNTESSSINFNFFYDKPKKIKDSKQIHILGNINFLYL